MSLRKKAFQAVRWTGGAMIGRALIQLVQLIVLSHLLRPADFGLMAMVMTVIVLAQIIADGGVSNALIHYRDVTADELSGLFWLNIGAGLALTLLIMGASPLVAAFFQEPRLTPLAMLLSLSFIITSTGQQLRVIAQKELHFAPLTAIELSAATLGAIVSVALALQHAGVYALAFGSLASASAGAVLSWALLSRGWRPALRCRWSEIRRFASYGVDMMGVNLLGSVNMQSDIIVGGRALGHATLGFYSLPRDLCMRIMMVINPIITRVGLPMMAEARANPAFVRSIYLKTVRMTTSTNFPIYAAIALLAPDIMAVVFGPTWAPTAPILQILAVSSLFRSVNNPVGSLLYALGRTRSALIAALVVMGAAFPILWIGAQWGLVGLALANVAFFAASITPHWYFLIRPACGVGFIAYHRQILIPLVTTIIATLGAYLAIQEILQPLARLIVGGGVGGVLYLGLSFLLNRPWLDAARELAFRTRAP